MKIVTVWILVTAFSFCSAQETEYFGLPIVSSQHFDKDYGQDGHLVLDDVKDGFAYPEIAVDGDGNIYVQYVKTKRNKFSGKYSSESRELYTYKYNSNGNRLKSFGKKGRIKEALISFNGYTSQPDQVIIDGKLCKFYWTGRFYVVKFYSLDGKEESKYEIEYRYFTRPIGFISGKLAFRSGDSIFTADPNGQIKKLYTVAETFTIQKVYFDANGTIRVIACDFYEEEKEVNHCRIETLSMESSVLTSMNHRVLELPGKSHYNYSAIVDHNLNYLESEKYLTIETPGLPYELSYLYEIKGTDYLLGIFVNMKKYLKDEGSFSFKPMDALYGIYDRQSGSLLKTKQGNFLEELDGYYSIQRALEANANYISIISKRRNSNSVVRKLLLANLGKLVK